VQEVSTSGAAVPIPVPVRALWPRRRQSAPVLGIVAAAPAPVARPDVPSLPGEAAFRARLDEEFARAERHGRPLSVIVLGCGPDGAIGDDVADLLRGVLRPGSLLARLDVHELALVLPEADGMDAYVAAERLVRTARAGRTSPGPSAGVCDLEQALAPDDLVRLARAALAYALRDGGDRIWRYSAQLAATAGIESPLRTESLAGIRALALAIDAKHPATLGHAEAVAEMAVELGAELGFSDPELERLELAALVHDVGKMGVPDAILLKPARLSSAEHYLVQLHAALGAQIASEVLATDQVAWVRSHHERPDGTGYPDRLSGEAIPLGARIIAVADAWDTMIAGRPWAPALDTEDALAECLRHAGTQFDVKVVDALVRVLQARHRADRDIA